MKAAFSLTSPGRARAGREAGDLDDPDDESGPSPHSSMPDPPTVAQASSIGPHLLSVADLGARGIEDVMRVADSFAEVNRRAIPKVPALRGRTVVSFFAEESTRTRISFETAARRLSADVTTFNASASSLAKGESLRDTIRTIEAMGADAFVVRHRCAGVPAQIARWLDEVRQGGTPASVLNAGDGWHEHPTQALADCYALRAHLARRAGRLVEETGVEDFEGLKVGIVGDISHSRVARSNVLAFSLLGAQVTLVAPGSLMPPSLVGWPVHQAVTDLDAVLGELDVCYVLRLQTERGAGHFLPSLREYTAGFGLTAKRLGILGEAAVVMHPGPVVRGVELASQVADDSRCIVLDQVKSGLCVRMALLFMLLGSNS